MNQSLSIRKLPSQGTPFAYLDLKQEANFEPKTIAESVRLSGLHASSSLCLGLTHRQESAGQSRTSSYEQPMVLAATPELIQTRPTDFASTQSFTLASTSLLVKHK